MRKQYTVLFSYVACNMHVEDLCVVQAYSKADALLQAKLQLAKCEDFANVQVNVHTAQAV